jgi:hypothetical protein
VQSSLTLKFGWHPASISAQAHLLVRIATLGDEVVNDIGVAACSGDHCRGVPVVVDFVYVKAFIEQIFDLLQIAALARLLPPAHAPHVNNRSHL